MKCFPLFMLTLALTAACNTTPETTLNEDFPPLVAAQPEATSAPLVESENTEQALISPDSSDDVTPVAIPTASPSGEETPSATPAQAEPVSEAVSEASFQTLSSGNFQDAVHKVSGRALLIQGGGQKFVRLEDFLTENGPDLHLYLVQNPTGSPDGNDFVNLGKLRSTQGNVNYEIPAEVDLNSIQSVSVWCKAFSVNFGFAQLSQDSSNS